MLVVVVKLYEMSSEGIDEMLSEAVREYPALYDKSKKGHHDKRLVQNCWAKYASSRKSSKLFLFI